MPPLQWPILAQLAELQVLVANPKSEDVMSHAR